MIGDLARDLFFLNAVSQKMMVSYQRDLSRLVLTVYEKLNIINMKISLNKHKFKTTSTICNEEKTLLLQRRI